MRNKFIFVLAFSGLFLLFPQFLHPYIYGGDYVGLNMHTFWNQLIAPAWSTEIDLGWNGIPFLQYYFYSLLQYVASIIFLGNVVLVEKITWWGVYIFLSFFSAVKLSSFFVKEKKYLYISGLVFCINTYSLMILSGGQIAGIGLSYALAPLVFYTFLKLLERKNITASLGFALTFSLSIIFDLRIAFTESCGLAIALILMTVLSDSWSMESLKKIFLYILVIPFVVVLLTHLYWILPSALYPGSSISQIGTEYTSISSLKFFSFAKLENSFSLLHPNWPENFFGKTYFMFPEFLVFPLLMSTLFVLLKKEEKYKNYLYVFLFIFLTGVFFAKGINDPFGFVYEFAFKKIPGFMLLRDPTKWYVLIAISYSVFIPLAVSKIGSLMKKETLVVGLFILFYGLLLKSLFGGMNGTFISQTVPSEVQILTNNLSHDSTFSRVLWFPSPHYSKHSSLTHPILYSSSFLKNVDSNYLKRYIISKKFEEEVRNYSVGYIVLYQDNDEKAFLKKQTYYSKDYASLSSALSNLAYLKKEPQYKKIAVFKVSGAIGKFRISNGSVDTKTIKPDSYSLKVTSTAPSVFSFSELFNPYWRLKDIDTGKIYFSKNMNGINSFNLPKMTQSNILLEFYPRKLLAILIPVSFFSWIIFVSLYVYLEFLRKRFK